MFIELKPWGKFSFVKFFFLVREVFIFSAKEDCVSLTIQRIKLSKVFYLMRAFFLPIDIGLILLWEGLWSFWNFQKKTKRYFLFFLVFSPTPKFFFPKNLPFFLVVLISFLGAFDISAFSPGLAIVFFSVSPKGRVELKKKYKKVHCL